MLAQSMADATLALGRFCAARGIDQHHRLVATLLAGDGTAVEQAARAYEAAGATDLLLGFADFPATDMLEAFAATVIPALRAQAAANPGEYCQIFSMNTEGSGPRQVTHLNSRVCSTVVRPGMLPTPRNRLRVLQAGLPGAGDRGRSVFDTNCDPLGANRSGYQLFAMRPDGDGHPPADRRLRSHDQSGRELHEPSSPARSHTRRRSTEPSRRRLERGPRAESVPLSLRDCRTPGWYCHRMAAGKFVVEIEQEGRRSLDA